MTMPTPTLTDDYATYRGFKLDLDQERNVYLVYDDEGRQVGLVRGRLDFARDFVDTLLGHDGPRTVSRREWSGV